MIVHFVGAGPGDPELLTLKAARLLREAKVCIYAGSLVSPGVLALLSDPCEKHDSAALDLAATLEICARARDRGLDVVRLHSGDPSIYGAIREQMDGLDALDIAYEVTPGVSAFQASAAALCTELTVPEESQTIILSRTKGRTPMPEHQDLPHLAALRATLCLYLSAHKVAEVAEELIPFYGAECPAAVVEKASWPEQRILRGTLADIGTQTEAAGIRATALVLVGQALRRGHAVSRLYASDFSHGFREAR
ncbi:MAG TPA: precorrin-4 C(11)-methyltransferase [Holophaga sp.]|nr:precorrin-4 C(11)-methyltransferase [Holophaga sp.]